MPSIVTPVLAVYVIPCIASCIAFAVYVPSSADAAFAITLYNFTVPYFAIVLYAVATAFDTLISPVVSSIDKPFSFFTFTTPKELPVAGFIVI